MKTAPMAGKSWQPSHKSPRHAEGPPNKAMASSERMGVMAEFRHMRICVDTANLQGNASALFC